jgi:hypothetical protein
LVSNLLTRSESLDGPSRAKNDGEIFLSQRTREQTCPEETFHTLHDDAISLSTVKNWLRRIKSSDLSCGDEKRPGRPLIFMGPALQRFLKKFPFASARVMTRHFSMDRVAINSILDRETRLRRFTRRSMTHI